VATPLAWDEVTRNLDPSAFTLHSVPDRLAHQRADPWEDFAGLRQRLPDVAAAAADRPAAQANQPTGKPAGKTVIVSARKPRRHSEL
jgi:hypothetical protein